MIAGGLSRFGGSPVAARHTALGIIDRSINAQAAVLAYGDIFFYVAVPIPTFPSAGISCWAISQAPLFPQRSRSEDVEFEAEEAEAAVH